LTPWPGTSIPVEGLGRLKILEVRVHTDLQGSSPGVLEQKNGMILMGTSKGALELRRMQWEGKGPIGVVEFLNGLKGRGQALPLRLKSEPK
jgi:methionyl-tRNA formyltransferase